jgi:hypothetical protein
MGKYRGLDSEGTWRYGYIIESIGKVGVWAIYPKLGSTGFKVDPETVGQFMLHHKRGAKFPSPEIAFDIWEGDKIYVAGIGNLCCMYDDKFAEWFFSDNEDPNADQYDYHEIIEDIEAVIGNIHEESDDN